MLLFDSLSSAWMLILPKAAPWTAARPACSRDSWFCQAWPSGTYNFSHWLQFTVALQSLTVEPKQKLHLTHVLWNGHEGNGWPHGIMVFFGLSRWSCVYWLTACHVPSKANVCIFICSATSEVYAFQGLYSVNTFLLKHKNMCWWIWSSLAVLGAELLVLKPPQQNFKVSLFIWGKGGEVKGHTDHPGNNKCCLKVCVWGGKAAN